MALPTDHEPARFADVDAAVRNLIAAYTHALDDGRTADVVATFTPDGTVDIPGLGVHQGHAALTAAYSAWQPTRPQRHLVLNTHLPAWDQDEASAVSDMVLIVMGSQGWRVQLVGRYHDHLKHLDGTWRFARRAATFVTPDPKEPA